MEQLVLGIGTRLQHTQFGPGVIVGLRYATYLISFIHHGIKEIDKTDELGDKDSADLLTGISRTLDLQLWFLEAHTRRES